ncbi:CBS domain-containing protein [Lacimicrobium sp. SS2-24]|uniref:CBS domain-containing protein n=1 Tax=Lacimicrobium sp. SS2-24 TaxID=2005569 RepID=UPI001AEFBB51|nr:CBS domain-containing protein [Lacimicrobium sp. SS2-24]
MQVKDIMTTDLHTLSETATLQDAHNMSREYGIRHIPVVDSETGKLRSVVTQKALISKVMRLARIYGEEELPEQEKAVPIQEVAIADCDTIGPEHPLLDMAEYFLAHKHGCLPVVDERGALQGIITSSDFVKLAITLLKHQAAPEF